MRPIRQRAMTNVPPISLPERRRVLITAALCLAQAATAQTGTASPPPPGAAEWLRRMHAAARQHGYTGTFVVTYESGEFFSARVWHVCEGDLQMERVDALSGPPRSTFRRNDLVVTFLPEAKVVKSEKRENFKLFPHFSGAPGPSIADFYTAQVTGQGRVAGFDADVVQLAPRDDLRFGYRMWSERRSGLVVQLQTLDHANKVIEQSAFSELQLDAPVETRTLERMMADTAGYRVEAVELEHASAQNEGWALDKPVMGFKPVNCYRRPGGGAPGYTVQWTFSDGLASVSLFLEPYGARRRPREALLAIGATYTLTRRLTGSGDWWLTAVGEVPPKTLEAFAQGLSRVR
jgi:sigma-E factor negative regulatory protein RseB